MENNLPNGVSVEPPLSKPPIIGTKLSNGLVKHHGNNGLNCLNPADDYTWGVKFNPVSSLLNWAKRPVGELLRNTL
jgi:hypothetical protein